MTIVEELRQNRESGAKRLEAEYKAGLMTLARRFCVDHGDAEELVNRTFAAVVEGIDDYLEQSAFFGWMCQILTNIHNKDRRNKSNGIIVHPGEVPDIVDEDAEDRIFRELDASLLRSAVERLPEDQREAVVLHYFADMPVAKIARYLKIPTGTVLSRLHYARKALAVKLGAEVKEMSKKPGVKAVLLALALCATAALGAVWWGELSERAAAILGSGGVATRETATIATIDIRHPMANTETRIPNPAQPSDDLTIRRFDDLTKGDTMNATTRTAALGAATALALAAAPPAATADSYQNRGTTSWDGQSWVYDTSQHVAAQPSTGASPSVALAASRDSGVSADGPLDAVFVTRQISNGSPINGGTPAFTLIIR